MEFLFLNQLDKRDWLIPYYIVRPLGDSREWVFLETHEMWFPATDTSDFFFFFCRLTLHSLFNPAQKVTDSIFCSRTNILDSLWWEDFRHLLCLWIPIPFLILYFHKQFVNSTCNTATYAVFGILNSSSLSQSISLLVNPNASNVIYLHCETLHSDISHNTTSSMYMNTGTQCVWFRTEKSSKAQF